MYEIRAGLWYVGIFWWLFGVSDRSIAAIADGYISALDLILLFTALS